MEESFARDTPALRFQLPWVQWREGPRWLLWPAWGWRVVAPRPRQRRLNIFQKAVLGLCRAGVVRAEEIGARLMIDAELAAHIAVELQGIAWLDTRGRPTERGLRALDEDESEELDEPTVGWVFTDPFSGEVWPRFHAGELPHVETRPNEQGFPMLVSGSVGDPRLDPAFSVLPLRRDALRIERPRAEDVLRAVRAHRRQQAWWEEGIRAADAPYLQRVSFVEEGPTAYLLAVRAYRDKGGDFRVDDPFGIGDSGRLRRWVEGRFDVHLGLRDWLAVVAGGGAEPEDLKSLGQRAAWEVEEKLSIAVRERAVLCERLVAMQRALLETELEGCPEDRWDDIAVKAQRAAERLFQEVCEAHPARAPLSQDVALNEALLNDLAASAGFTTPLPRSLTRVRRGKVQFAAEQGSGSLRPLVLLALLGTAGAPDHPLARAARAPEGRELLRRLDTLASVRDQAAHEIGGRRHQAGEGYRRRIREGVETVFVAARLLLST